MNHQEINEWRAKHPRCRYCKYCNARKIPMTNTTVMSCEVKDKYFHEPIWLDIRGMFCKLYEAKEVKED